MENQTCETCKFRNDNLCNRYPPTFLLLPTQNKLTGETGMQPVMNQVFVELNMWCGEYYSQFN